MFRLELQQKQSWKFDINMFLCALDLFLPAHLFWGCCKLCGYRILLMVSHTCND